MLFGLFVVATLAYTPHSSFSMAAVNVEGDATASAAAAAPTLDWVSSLVPGAVSDVIEGELQHMVVR